MDEIDVTPLLDRISSLAGKALRFARHDEAEAINAATAQMRNSLENFRLSKGQFFSVCRSIEARLSRGEPELNDVITSGPVS